VFLGTGSLFDSTLGKLEFHEFQRKRSVSCFEVTHFELVLRRFDLEETHFFDVERLFLFVLWIFLFE
jgi:hypothetical protein